MQLKKDMLSLPFPAPLFYNGLLPFNAGQFKMSPIHVKSWFPVKITSAREMKIGHILLLSVFLLVPVFYSYLSYYLQ